VNTKFGILVTVIIYGIPLILAITLHEAAHGYAALSKGDDTARRAGRLSLNPLRHIDLVGTILIPLMLIALRAPFIFGYAKPVPVNFNALRNPRRDMVYVAAAGPLTNFVLAFISAALFHILFLFPYAVALALNEMLGFSLLINVMLGVFNLLPLPPLDGGRVAVGLLPDSLARPLAQLEPWGLLILFTGFIILPIVLSLLGIIFDPFKLLLEDVIFGLVRFIAYIAGVYQD
jgi:Zn-dependent protease